MQRPEITAASLALFVGLAAPVLQAQPVTSSSSSPALTQPATPANLAPASRPAAPARATQPVLSAWALEVLKLVQAGLNDDILYSYIESAGTFNLGSEQIIHLHQSGVSSQLISAMILHDADIISGVKPVLSSTSPQSPVRFRKLEPEDAVSRAGPGEAYLAPMAPEWPAPAFDGGGGPLVIWSGERDAPEQPQELFPVRKPYAVRLTDPIVVIRTAGRAPNITFFQSFQ